jgi:hypothetical protein
MPHQTKTASLFFLLLFILLLAGCAKQKIAFKPRPSPIPQAIPVPEFPMMRIEINGQKMSPLVPTLFMLPEDPLVIRIFNENGQAAGNQNNARSETGSWSVVFNGHPMTLEGTNLFSGSVPKAPGFYPLEIESRQELNQAPFFQNSHPGQRNEKTGPALLVIVLHPYSRLKDGFIDLYPIGFYPRPEKAPVNIIPKNALSQYLPPKGFIEVTPENQRLLVSRHYRLQDFSCRLNAPFPHFIALSPALLLKLELLTLNLKQYLQNPEARLTILNSFRPPGYNHSVSGALWSRHIYGDAADIIVDISPQDRLMDDLNHDGRIDREDVMVLANMIESIERENGLSGGLGVYDWLRNGKEGPYLHIDTRGFKIRWERQQEK